MLLCGLLGGTGELESALAPSMKPVCLCLLLFFCDFLFVKLMTFCEGRNLSSFLLLLLCVLLLLLLLLLLSFLLPLLPSSSSCCC